jgi:hypothetical protein
MSKYLVKSSLFIKFTFWLYDNIGLPISAWIACIRSSPPEYYIRDIFWHYINYCKYYESPWDDYLNLTMTHEYLKSLEQDITDAYVYPD